MAFSRVHRSDVTRLGKFPRNGAGAVRVPATISRTGIQVYPGAGPNGTDLREYRPAEEVFAEDSLASLGSVPVTLGHPQSGVNPGNMRDVQIGHVTDAPPETRVKLDSSDEEWVRTQLVVADGAALAVVDGASDALEVSCGYDCDLEMTPGKHPVTGEAYDAIQRNIKFNHVAILPPGQKARAGADAKLRLDAKETMKVILIDGVEYELGGEKHLAKLDADHKAALTAANARADKAEAKADAAEERAKKAEAQVNVDALDARVAQRYQLLTRAGRFLPKEYDTAGKKDATIRFDAVEAKLGAGTMAGKSEVYVEARFDSLAETAEADRAQYHNPNTDGAQVRQVDIANDDNAFRAALAARAKGNQ